MLERVIKKMKIENAVWCAGESGRYYQVFFSVSSGDHAEEEILRHLKEMGIGNKFNSVVSVMPCTLYYQGLQHQIEEYQLSDDLPAKEDLNYNKTSAWQEFLMSVRARLTVAQVVEGVKANALLTFDFLFLLSLSSVVAAMGLVENSTVMLVASMLISPLMGPIMAGTFGTVIADRYLQKIGVLNELYGLLVCIAVGFVFGIIAGLATDHWGTTGWPTSEMISSIIQVGLLWALSFNEWVRPGHLQLVDSNLDPSAEAKYTSVYSDEPSIELAVLGVTSLGLTFVNIICIFIAGILVLKFWKHDIKVARDYNRTLSGQEADDLQIRIAEELANSNLKNELPPTLLNRLQSLGKPFLTIEEILDQAGVGGYNTQLTWSPDILARRRTSIISLNSLSAKNSEKHLDTKPQQPPKRRRHSEGPWINRDMSKLKIPGRLQVPSPAVSSQKPSLEIIKESPLTPPPHRWTESNASTTTLDSQYEGDSNGRRERFTVTLATDPTLHV
ncbi:hypothetical protein C0J52_19036 [Blattella germanica]|nr:hypothetical protein C0J52_19036 [Blattella germanica]